MLLVLSLFACQESRIPEDALYFDVQVEAADTDDDSYVDNCHPDDDVKAYKESFTYALVFEASAATIYIGEDVFASGTITGCSLTYETVVIGEETDGDGEVKWKLVGVADVDVVEGDACVDGDDDWSGSEYFEIVSSSEETLEPGCTYEMSTVGGRVSTDG